jgi:hypothetical protein
MNYQAIATAMRDEIANPLVAICQTALRHLSVTDCLSEDIGRSYLVLGLRMPREIWRW